jgi:hypothetical protein
LFEGGFSLESPESVVSKSFDENFPLMIFGYLNRAFQRTGQANPFKPEKNEE